MVPGRLHLIYAKGGTDGVNARGGSDIVRGVPAATQAARPWGTTPATTLREDRDMAT